MLLISIDPQKREPLYRQVCDGLRTKIDQGLLKPGDRLPSTRSLADRLGVNRTTIYKAYEELWALGYIESSPGSYTTIRRPVKTSAANPDHKQETYSWKDAITEGSKRLFSDPPEMSFTSDKNDLIDFRPLSPDPDLIPAELYRKCLNQVIREKGNKLLQYGDPKGYLPLRTFLAQRMKHHGIRADEEEVIITNGIQNGLELIMKLMIRPTSSIMVEEPTYSAALPLFLYHTKYVCGVPMDHQGVQLAKLEENIHKHQPAFFYTIPNFHNPTGITTSQDHREQVIAMAEKYRIPILEDGFEEEMKYFGKAILPIKSMDRSGLVLYLGTFSKVLFPGLRVGWIVAGKELAEKLALLKLAGDLSGNNLDQAALALFCQLGHYERHIRRMHRIYRKRMHAALKAAREYLVNDMCSYTKPMGGYTFWVETKAKHEREPDLMRHLLNQGVAVHAGSSFYHSAPDRASFRISIAHRKENEIQNGIHRISEVLKKF